MFSENVTRKYRKSIALIMDVVGVNVYVLFIVENNM